MAFRLLGLIFARSTKHGELCLGKGQGSCCFKSRWPRWTWPWLLNQGGVLHLQGRKSGTWERVERKNLRAALGSYPGKLSISLLT